MQAERGQYNIVLMPPTAEVSTGVHGPIVIEHSLGSA
jgi:hypothetical protein